MMDFIPELDISLSATDRAKTLEEARDQIWDSVDDPATDRRTLSEHDVTLLRGYAADAAPEVRNATVETLGEYGPVTWEDAVRWTLDDSEDVRRSAFSRIGLSYNALAELCYADKPRCVELFAASAKRHGSLATEAWLLCLEGEDWLDLFWSHLGPLLDLGNPGLNTNIICGILESILAYDRLITVDDPRVQSWIKGDSVERKMALLSVVQWFGMRKSWQRTIAEALAGDPIEAVSWVARRLLSGKPVPDIQSRGWADQGNEQPQT